MDREGDEVAHERKAKTKKLLFAQKATVRGKPDTPSSRKRTAKTLVSRWTLSASSIRGQPWASGMAIGLNDGLRSACDELPAKELLDVRIPRLVETISRL